MAGSCVETLISIWNAEVRTVIDTIASCLLSLFQEAQGNEEAGSARMILKTIKSKFHQTLARTYVVMTAVTKKAYFATSTIAAVQS